MKINLLRKLRKAVKIWRGRGVSAVGQHTRWKLFAWREHLNYQKWIRKIDTLTDTNRAEMRREIENFDRQPLISVVMPVYNVEEKWLRLCVESVLRQIYENWELCVADDCSPSPHIRQVLEEYAEKDKRIKVIFRAENGHISAASNSALELANGEFVALLDHDDELAEHALFYVVKEINEFPETAMIYSDEDLINENGKRYEPKFKPDWSRDLFYSLNLITHLSVYRTTILRKIGGFRIGLEGSQDYDLALRLTEQISENRIRHIPRILYHWRAIQGSVALSGDEKPYAHERAREALRSHFERMGKRAVISQNICNLHRVQYELPAHLPKVSLIILADEDFQAAENAIKNYGENTDYQDFEIVLVCSETTKAHIPKATQSLGSMSVSLKFIVCECKSEAEKYNFAVSQTDGEILCFADINLKPLSIDWLKELVNFATEKEIGVVGAKILYANESVLHGGLIIGTSGAVGIAHHHLPRTEDGNFVRAQVTGNFSAVSVAGFATRREIFESVGGFGSVDFPNKLFDADFCLKLRERDYRIVFTPYAELIKIDTKRRSSLEEDTTAEEKKRFVEKWHQVIKRDPFYNPNLSKKDASFSIDV